MNEIVFDLNLFVESDKTHVDIPTRKEHALNGHFVLKFWQDYLYLGQNWRIADFNSYHLFLLKNLNNIAQHDFKIPYGSATILFSIFHFKKEVKPNKNINNFPQKSVYTWFDWNCMFPDLKFDEESDFDVPGTSSVVFFEIIARNHIFCVKLLGASC